MFDYRNFDEVYDFNPSFAYNVTAVENIGSNRRDLDGLFVDKVLMFSDIKQPTKYYPPRTNGDLRALHQAIVSGTSAEHAKLSLLYYILLDCDDTPMQIYADAFEQRSFLPKGYQILMKGLWHMDRLEFELALQYLTHPSLVPTFYEEILQVLVKHSSNNDYALALAYHNSVQLPVVGPQALQSLFSAIACTSVLEAFYFLREQPETIRRQMFETLISTVLHLPAGEAAASQGVELVNLPFSPEEEGWFEHYLISGEGQRLNKAKDTVLLRRIGTGRFAEALSVEGLTTRARNGLDWVKLQEGLQDGLGSRVDNHWSV